MTNHDNNPWESTGIRYTRDTNYDRIPEFDSRSGDHLWNMLVMYKWKPGDTPVLDQENLLSIIGPGCFFCEQMYDEIIAKRRCKGPL